MLTAEQIERFISDGFVRVSNAFSPELAAECRELLWKQLDMEDPDDSSTWTRELVRLGLRDDEPFVRSANTPVLHAAYDQLVGPGRWHPLEMVGTFPVRFPMDQAPEDAEDYGWHIDAGFFLPEPGTTGVPDWTGEFPSVPPDYDLVFRCNVVSRGRALLVLILYSDTGPEDAPTQIRVGSHLDVARWLEPYGMEGTYLQSSEVGEGRPHALATGNAGDVYLCHPFVVHTPINNRGKRPRFLAQPSLQPVGDLELERDSGQHTPVEEAVRMGLGA